MMSAFKLFPMLVALPLAFVGCTSTNPKSAFDDVGRHVAARTGQEVRWMRDNAERNEIEKAVAALLQTNLTAQSCVGIALLNNGLNVYKKKGKVSELELFIKGQNLDSHIGMGHTRLSLRQSCFY